MDALDFIDNYTTYISEIKEVTTVDLHPILDRLASIDPHDLVRPDSWFPNINSAKGFVWSLFVSEVKRSKQNHIEISPTSTNSFQIN